MEGAKAGSGKARSAVIQEDSASSITDANVVYGMCEGEIEGLADGYRSIRLDGTPLQNKTGEMNFDDVSVEFKKGTVDQEPLLGFPNVVSQIDYNNIEVTDDRSFIHHINDTQFTSANVRLIFGAIFKTNPSNGDTGGYTIQYAIDIQVDGLGFNQYATYTLSDKTSANYERGHPINLPAAEESWDIRVRRITPNENSQYIGDKMYVASVAQTINARFSYPYTSVLGLKYNASRFSSVAKLAVRLKGKIIRIPMNMDPNTGNYATTGAGTTNGMWDGSFKWAYSNNPAWVYYDLCLNTRYGLGKQITADKLDKWSLYTIGKYCDEQVPDGYGKTEKRFTVNVYISSFFEAHDCLLQLSGVFRGILYYNGTQLRMEMDRPRDPVYTYNLSNIIGKFAYKSSKAKERFSVITVEYDDPELEYKTVPMTVFDRTAMREIGVKTKKIQAFGCTSRGQAQRVAYWLLYKNLYETRSVTFKVGLDGFVAPTGRIIEIADQKFAGRANGGRIAEVSSDKKTITIDRDAGKVGDRLVVNGEDGVSESREVILVVGRRLTVSQPFDNVAAENAFALDSDDLALMRFTVVTATMDQTDNSNAFTISAVQHTPSIFDASEFNVFLDQRPTTVINPELQDPVTRIDIGSDTKVVQGISVTDLIIMWNQVPNAVKYAVQYQKDDGQWINAPDNYSNTCIIENVYTGVYKARIVAISASDLRSKATISNPFPIVAKFTNPPNLAKFTATGILFGVELAFDFLNGSQNGDYTEIQVALAADKNDAKTLTLVPFPQKDYSYTGLKGGQILYYRGRLVDKNGFQSDWTAWVTATVSEDPDLIMDIIKGHIGIEAIDAALAAQIELAETNAIEALNTANQVKVTTEASVAQLNQDIATERQDRLNQGAQLQDGITNVQTIAQGAVNDLNAYKVSNNEALGVISSRIDAVATDTSLALSRVNALDGRLGTAEQNVASALEKSQIAIDANTALAETVRSNTAAIGTKADSSYVEQVKAIADTANATANANTTVIQSLKSTVDGNTAQINNVQQTKADKTEVASIAQQALQSVWKADAQAAADGLKPSIDSATDLAKLITNGKLLYPDVNFKEGNNSIVSYDNLGGGLNKVSTVPKAGDNPTSSQNQIDVTVSGTASPGLGGFYQLIQTRPNAVFVIKYLIKLPVGYSLQCAANAMGDDSKDYFVGSQEGTGRFTTYIRVVKCGATGSFSTTGFVYAAGSLQPSQTMVMSLAQLEVYDVTDFYNVQDDLNLFKSTVTQTYQTKADAASTTANIITQLESKASVTQAQNIADNTIKNTNIGGTNLITGTRYFDTSGNLKPNYVGFGNLYNSPTDLLFGKNYIYLVTTSWCGFYFTGFPNDTLQEDCVLSFWASSQNNADVHVYNIANGGQLLGVISGAVWKQYSFILTKGTKVRNANNQGVVEFDIQAGTVLGYSSIQLQVGSKATAWTPAVTDATSGSRNLVRNTGLKHEGYYWVFQEPLTTKVDGVHTLSFDIEVVSGGELDGGIGFNMGDDGTSGYEYLFYPNMKNGHHSYTYIFNSKNFTHLAIYCNNSVKIKNVKFEKGNVESSWTAAPEDLVVGGRNILRNTDFSKQMQYWSTYNATITLGRETIEGKETAYAYIVSQGATGGLYVKPVDMPYVAKAGDVMTLSFYGRGNGSIIAGFDDIYDNLTVDGTWKRYTVTLKRLRSDNVIFYLTGATYLDVALPKLELGSIATAWSPAPEDIESKLVDFRAEVVNTYSTKADTTSAVASGITEFRADLGNVKTYTAASSYLDWSGIRNARGVDLNRTWRSYGVDIFNENGDWARTYRYDVLGNPALADEVAARINEAAEKEIVVITTYDEPATGRNAAMRAAFISIGGTGVAFDNIAYRSVYLLIGKKGLKEGGGIEQFTSNATIEYPMQFINGRLAAFTGSAAQQLQTSATASLLTQTQAKVSEHDGQISSLVQQTTTLTSNVTQAQNTANQAITDAANAITNRSEAINLTNGAYLQDLWYPVGIGGLSAGTRSNISIYAFLDNSSHPTWATHGGGFSLNLQWNTIGSGWGVIPVDRIINSFSHAWTASSLSPVTQISQFGASSIEVIWLRGGGVYYANFPKSASIYLPSTTDGSLTDPITGEKASSMGYNAALVPKTVDEKTTTNSVVLQQQAEVINGIQAKWTVKINNNGYGAGFGLISEPNNGAITSAFMVDADAFVVGKAGTNIKPIVAVAAGQTIEGVYYPESGTYLNSAWISRATIKLAHIDTATIVNLRALSASFGNFMSGTAGGARIEQNDNGQQIYDANNRLRVKIGKLN